MAICDHGAHRSRIRPTRWEAQTKNHDEVALRDMCTSRIHRKSQARTNNALWTQEEAAVTRTRIRAGNKF